MKLPLDVIVTYVEGREMNRYRPMKASSASSELLDEVEDDPNYGIGEKYDGFRTLLYIEDDGSIRLFNQSGTEQTANVPGITGIKILDKGLYGTVLDGEGIGSDRRIESTKSVFGSSPEYAIEWQKQHGNAQYKAFDILKYGRTEVIESTLRERRILLTDVILTLRARGIKDIDIETLVTTNKRIFFERIVAAGGEGVMVKDLNAQYHPGMRSNGWTKVKRVDSWDTVIVGFTEGKGKYEGVIGAIRYGFMENGVLKEAGKSSGMTDAYRAMFASDPASYIGRVAEIEGQEIGKNGAIRFPRFLRLRTDKLPEECSVN